MRRIKINSKILQFQTSYSLSAVLFQNYETKISFIENEGSKRVCKPSPARQASFHKISPDLWTFCRKRRERTVMPVDVFSQ